MTSVNKVEHVVLSVTTVEVFIQTMRYLEQNELWEEAQAHLVNNDKEKMFIDAEAMTLLGDMMERNSRCEPDSEPFATIGRHLRALKHNICRIFRIDIDES